jgi:hypothetical protein
VLEHVRGEHIDRHCDSRGLGVEARVRFSSTCPAGEAQCPVADGLITLLHRAAERSDALRTAQIGPRIRVELAQALVGVRRFDEVEPALRAAEQSWRGTPHGLRRARPAKRGRSSAAPFPRS